MLVGSEEYQAPSRLAVDNCCITQAGTEEQIQSLCCKVQELDIAKNRVTDWQEVKIHGSYELFVTSGLQIL